VLYEREFPEGSAMKPPSAFIIFLWKLLNFRVTMEIGGNLHLRPGLMESGGTGA
jgi:hypothetical protein